MKLTPVQSSAIDAIGHDPHQNELHVRFKGSAKVHIYPGVSASKHSELLAAKSIGKHFGKHIRPHHKPR